MTYAASPTTAAIAVRIETVDPTTGIVQIQAASPGSRTVGGRLLLASDLVPLGWGSYAGANGANATFRLEKKLALDVDTPALNAWWIEPASLAKLIAHWPPEAELFAQIDSVGPAAATAWIRRGSNDGVQVGDAWWLRVAGQPVARFDVLLVEPEMSFCRACPLVRDAPILPRQRVMLWPSPAMRRAGLARSAVTFVEADETGRTWVPWPPAAGDVSSPFLEFYRAGRYLGHAVADRRDDRFWYARPIRGASAAEVRAGDEVRIRTRADVDQRRFVARVFETSAEGTLIAAGEADGLVAGQECWVFRDDTLLFAARIRRVQREYAVLGFDGTTAAEQICVNDQVRFALPSAAAPTQVVGVIEQLVDDTLIRVRARDNAALPLHTPLAVRSGGRVCAVAVLVAGVGDAAIGYLPTAGLSDVVAPGAELEWTP